VVNHIQDLQVDAARDLNIIENESLLRLLEKTERWLLGKMSRVSTISKGMRKKIMAKGIPDEKIIMFPNWVDDEVIFPLTKAHSVKAEWGFEESDQIVLYSGNLGVKQGLESILNVADELRNRKNLYFIIVGDGGAKERLMRKADEMKLKNVIFIPLQPLERLAATLAAADVHLVLQKKAAADLVMPSKLTNILAMGGHALVTAEAGTTLHDVVKEHGLGTLVSPENDEELKKGLSDILAGNREDDAQGARAFANRYLNKHSIVSGFLRAINF
jgi:colanic acid biosynthesis glycosyl transferase WcaI